MTVHAGPAVWVEQIMGMPISIHVRGESRRSDAVEAAVAQAFATLRRFDEIFSTYREDSDINRLARGEITMSDCDPLVAEALEIGARAGELTGGVFTVVLPAPDLTGDRTGADGELAERIFDPTGLVKGWAAGRAAGHLANIPGIAYCLNAGGDLVAGVGPGVPVSGPDAVTWRVGIEDPNTPGQIARVVPLVVGAVATSGTAARGAHLFNPHTDSAVSRHGSATVVGADLLWADIWATALFIAPEIAPRFAEAQPGWETFALPAA